MSIKQKLAMGILTGGLAISMIGGGTYAYFSDTEMNNTNNFAAGTLDINVAGKDPYNAIIRVENLKPGDKMTRNFTLNNTGSLDVSEVLLTSSYTVYDANGNNGNADLGENIEVTILKNNDKNTTVVSKTTLKALSTKDVVKKIVSSVNPSGEKSGLEAKTSDEFTVTFEFVDKGDQNVFQGDSLQLNWKFDAKQTAGESK